MIEIEVFFQEDEGFDHINIKKHKDSFEIVLFNVYEGFSVDDIKKEKLVELRDKLNLLLSDDPR